MAAIKIKDLYKMMKEQMELGHEDYVVFVTDDEEANGYHALWYSGQTAKEIGEDIDNYELCNSDLSVAQDRTKTYYIG